MLQAVPAGQVKNCQEGDLKWWSWWR